MQNERIEITTEDRTVLQNLRTESALYRGYPIGFLSGFFTYQAITKKAPKMKPILKWSIVVGVGMTGNILGRLSYLPTLIRRLDDQLPENSKLRAQMRQTLQFSSKKGQGNEEHIPNQNNKQYNVAVSHEEEEDKKKFLSYSDLLEAHRSQRTSISAQQPKIEIKEQSNETQNFDEKSEKTVRYNKYGDPIID